MSSLVARQVQMHEVYIQASYLNFIELGKKTVEGRIHVDRYTYILPKDVIRFIANDNPLHVHLCKVTARTLYPSFEQMLKAEGVENCLPDASSVEKGVEIYHSFPGYAEKAQKYSIIAFKIQSLSTKR